MRPIIAKITLDNRTGIIESFIEKVNKKHENKYDYSLVEYINNETKVKIICSQHGVFEQRPKSHLKYRGCPRCNDSHGEVAVSNFLNNNNILFEQEYKFDDCRNKNPLPFDFYLFNLNTCIEYQGKQHYESHDMFGGIEYLKYRRNNDKIKYNYCIDNDIKLIRIKYNENIENKLKKVLL